MKKFLSILTAAVLMAALAMPFTAGAQSAPEAVDFSQYRKVVLSTEVTYADDGSYFVDEVGELLGGVTTMATTYQRTGYRKREAFNSSNVLQIDVTLCGVFTYNGSTSSCTNSSYTYNIYYSAWRFHTGSTSKSGNIAGCETEFRAYAANIQINTCYININLACDKNGNLYYV